MVELAENHAEHSRHNQREANILRRIHDGERGLLRV